MPFTRALLFAGSRPSSLCISGELFVGCCFYILGQAEYAAHRVSLKHGELIGERDAACSALAKHSGRGDVVPLLDRPDLSDPA